MIRPVIRRVFVGFTVAVLSIAFLTPSQLPAHAVPDSTARAGLSATTQSDRAPRWTARRATVPLSGSAEDLRYLASECPDAKTCVSVGEDDGPIARTIISGREVTVRVSTPADRSTGPATLSLLSCASATFCVAGGEYSTTDPTFAGWFATWNGVRWTSVRAPVTIPGDQETYGELLGLSCGAPGHCTAVSQGTVYTLSGGHWRSSAAALPPGDDNPRLAGVSCTSASYCVITGTADNGKGTTTFASIRNGGTATAIGLTPPASWPDKKFGPDPLGLDCQARHCTVVAGGNNAPRYLIGLDGTKATYHRVPKPSGSKTDAFAYATRIPVSCPTKSTCWALDAYRLRGLPDDSDTAPVAIRLRGSAVKAVKIPDPKPHRPARAQLLDLACATSTSCTAVGFRNTNNGDPAFSEAVYSTLSGASWTSALAPVPEGAPSPRAYELDGVDCPTRTRCLADGQYRWDLRNGDEGFSFAHRRAVLAQSSPRR